jgi:hypothetical protein
MSEIGSGLKRTLRLVDQEALIWAAALVWLALSDPRCESRFTPFLPHYLFGLESPGRGLGHAIAWLFRGDLQQSLNAHWLGLPAVAILTGRIVALTVQRIRSFPKKEAAHG